MFGANIGNHQRPDARWAVHGHGGDVAFDRRDAAAAGVHDDGDAVAVLVGDLELGVREGLAGAGDGEMREAVHAANRFGVHERFGIEVRDFGGDLDRKILGVEMLDATDAGAPGDQSVPQRGDTDAERRTAPSPVTTTRFTISPSLECP